MARPVAGAVREQPACSRRACGAPIRLIRISHGIEPGTRESPAGHTGPAGLSFVQSAPRQPPDSTRNTACAAPGPCGHARATMCRKAACALRPPQPPAPDPHSKCGADECAGLCRESAVTRRQRWQKVTKRRAYGTAARCSPAATYARLCQLAGRLWTHLKCWGAKAPCGFESHPGHRVAPFHDLRYFAAADPDPRLDNHRAERAALAARRGTHLVG